jgi:hypothetical protein
MSRLLLLICSSTMTSSRSAISSAILTFHKSPRINFIVSILVPLPPTFATVSGELLKKFRSCLTLNCLFSWSYSCCHRSFDTLGSEGCSNAIPIFVASRTASFSYIKIFFDSSCRSFSSSRVIAFLKPSTVGFFLAFGGPRTISACPDLVRGAFLSSMAGAALSLVRMEAA